MLFESKLIERNENYKMLHYWFFRKCSPIAIEILPIAIEPEKHKFSDDDFSINSEPILMGPHFSERYLIDL